ncbi:MAG TPA: reverse transcriptase family protein, partial [Candidatus Dojkabacteria bacterium]|nr:reverse transcriptase family protein [Candidatus Dojkabacteria bacterium]
MRDEIDEEELLGDNIYIPNELDKPSLSNDEITKFIENQTKHLNQEQINQLISAILKEKRIFAVNPNNPGVQTKTKMHIELKPDTAPIKLPAYRASPLIANEIKKTISQLLGDGLIEKSTSSWSFPVVVVKKADGTYRFCVNYSKLTEKTIKDAYPLPRIDDTLDQLHGAKYFTVCDASSGFWQIPIAENDKEKLAFVTTFGTYQWKVMPFGFTNAPAVFQRAIQETLDGELFLRCLVYIDDICIYSKTFEQHIKDILIVFDKLNQHNWKLKLKKCQFAQLEIEYLGHVITENQIKVHPKNIDKVRNMKRPNCIKDIQGFLGSINYYRRFIPNLTELTQPLLLNLRKNVEFTWGNEQEEAYLRILELFCAFPILTMPDYNLPFILSTDASGVGYGGKLSQEIDGIARAKPISYFSGAFTQSQKAKWNHWQKEAFAAIRGIK